MAKLPKIVRESKKDIQELQPPRNVEFSDKGVSIEDVELYISKSALDTIRNHCMNYAEKKLEVMGFLIGNVYRWKDRTYTKVWEAVTTDLEATEVSVKFHREGFEKLFEKLDDLDFDYVIVGWYHSHPGYGCFMSAKDIDTQNRMFNQPYHTALVIDPIKNEVKAFRLEKGKYKERKFAVYVKFIWKRKGKRGGKV